MRIAVFSDIHANLEAFEAFVDDAARRKIDRYTCLGDLVGYGANPNACIEGVRALPQVAVLLGNHDAAATWVTSPYEMHGRAQAAIMWTMDRLTEDNRAFLENLPPLRREDNCVWAHASPFNPKAWSYVQDRASARLCLWRTRADLTFVAHTHRPLVIRPGRMLQLAFETPEHEEVVGLTPGRRLICNCGSVGQPRDGLAAGSYLVLDTDAARLEFIRFGYDVAKAAAKIRAAGLPEYFAERLHSGK
jgi:diadenosine tetraphosphatase ApaH/serine/threonine PP2A family protein phosphatase